MLFCIVFLLVSLWIKLLVILEWNVKKVCLVMNKKMCVLEKMFSL